MHFHSHHYYNGAGSLISTYIRGGIIIALLVLNRLWALSGYLTRGRRDR